MIHLTMVLAKKVSISSDPANVLLSYPNACLSNICSMNMRSFFDCSKNAISYKVKKPLPIAGAKTRNLYVNLKCTQSRNLGALYQFMVRKPVREYANDYLYISENIFVQTEPHIHPGCHFPYFSSNVNPVNSTYHLSTLSTQHP